MKPPPASLKAVNVLDPEERKSMKRAIKAAHSNTVREKLLKGLTVQLFTFAVISFLERSL